MFSDSNDIITPANFGEERSWGFGVATGRIVAFSLYLHRRHYNTLALLTVQVCEVTVLGGWLGVVATAFVVVTSMKRSHVFRRA